MNNGMKVLLVVLVLAVIGMGSYIVYDKIIKDDPEQVDNQKQKNDEENNEQTVKQNLTKDELTFLQNYINQSENNTFALIEYNDISKIFDNSKNVQKINLTNAGFLKYSIDSSNFARYSNDSEDEIIWGDIGPQVSTKVISLKNMVSYFKEKTNYDFSEKSISDAFSSYFNEQLNVFVFTISDDGFLNLTVTSSYKLGNEYNLTLENEYYPLAKIELIMIKEKNNYYFKSCNITN